MKNIHALILAAGKGTRMGGTLPKVMVPARGKPLILWVIENLNDAGISDITAVVGYKKDLVIDSLPKGTNWTEQAEQLGTGHAVLCAEDILKGFAGTVLVTCGDMPLIQSSTFKQLLENHSADNNSCTVLTSRIAPPHKYGRIVRNADGQVLKIVEAADATEDELLIDEVNTGVYAFDCKELFSALNNIGNTNNQGEYYLTDVLEILIKSGKSVGALICEKADEALGVNSPEDIIVVEKYLK
ncbi:MAG: sugar phosphate nucleotidyltransferase [Planctomycetota bacterium]|jgi:UDP-N-acetylglucosamine diphosphorylase/glucosamine-1-phosphate N-acetyltransferase